MTTKWSDEWLMSATDEDVKRVDRIVNILQEFAAHQEGTLDERLARMVPGAKRYGDYALEILEAAMEKGTTEYAVEFPDFWDADSGRSVQVRATMEEALKAKHYFDSRYAQWERMKLESAPQRILPAPPRILKRTVTTGPWEEVK